MMSKNIGYEKCVEVWIDYEEYKQDNNTYHNYEAERWDALTDGMEGDYPGSGVDYDLLGF